MRVELSVVALDHIEFLVDEQVREILDDPTPEALETWEALGEICDGFGWDLWAKVHERGTAYEIERLKGLLP